jgi:hypothetical protein
MTVSTSDIKIRSGYEVTVDYPQELFTQAKAEAENQVAEDAPGATAEIKEKLVGLLICNSIYVYLFRGERVTSERGGDTSVSREPTSAWISEYTALIRKYGKKQPSAGVIRSDYATSKAFALSDQQLPQMRYTDSRLIGPE